MGLHVYLVWNIIAITFKLPIYDINEKCFCLSCVYTCSPYLDLNLSNIEKISIIRGQSLKQYFPKLFISWIAQKLGCK